MTKPKKTSYKILQALMLLAIIGVFSWYIVENWAEFTKLSIERPALIPLIALAYVGNIFIMGHIINAVVTPYNIKLTQREIFGLSALTRFFKQIVPGYIGNTLRAVYLKKNYGLAYTKYAMGLTVSNVLQLIVSGAIAILMYILIQSSESATQQMVVVALVIALSVIGLTLPIERLATFTRKLYRKRPLKIIERTTAALEEYGKMRKDGPVIIKTVLMMIGLLAISAIAIILLYSVFGVEISMLSATLFVCLTSWATVFSITPSDLGVREGLMAIGAQLVGIPIPVTIAVTILHRLVMISIDSLLAIYFSPKLLKKSTNNL